MARAFNRGCGSGGSGCGHVLACRYGGLRRKRCKFTITCDLFTIHTMLSASHVTANSSTNHYLHNDNKIGICFFLPSFIVFYY